jgi:hypothetical protein
MTRIRIHALAAAFAAGAALGLTARPAAADVIFTFTQTGAMPADAVAFSGSLAVSDEAYAQGIDIAYGNSDPLPPSQMGLDQLVSLSFDFAVQRGFSRTFTEQDFYFQRSPSSSGRAYSFRFTSEPEGLPQGRVRFNDTEDQFNLDFDPVSGAGLFISDRGGAVCGRAPGCHFTFSTEVTASTEATASTKVTAVPEVASITLFCTGLVALAGAARRQGRRAAGRGRGPGRRPGPRDPDQQSCGSGSSVSNLPSITKSPKSIFISSAMPLAK